MAKEDQLVARWSCWEKKFFRLKVRFNGILTRSFCLFSVFTGSLTVKLVKNQMKIRIRPTSNKNIHFTVWFRHAIRFCPLSHA